MKELGHDVEIEPGDTGQFELFKWSTTLWMSFMKGGHGKFFGIQEVIEELFRQDESNAE